MEDKLGRLNKLLIVVRKIAFKTDSMSHYTDAAFRQLSEMADEAEMVKRSGVINEGGRNIGHIKQDIKNNINSGNKTTKLDAYSDAKGKLNSYARMCVEQLEAQISPLK